MQRRTRLLLQIIGIATLVAAAALYWAGRGGRAGIADPAASVRGEEVYASHDCTDCHLAVHVLRQKRDKKEEGLIRVRKDFDLMRKFLETDPRHQSFVMISEKDRRDLVEYLRSLIVK